jgi:integrase
MRVTYPGLLAEKMPSGAIRYRVRVEGQKHRRIPIPVGPDDPQFGNYYWSARAGEVWQPDAPKAPLQKSLDWLAARYIRHLEKLVEAGLYSPSTLRQRRSLLTRMVEIRDGDGDRYGGLEHTAPTPAWVKARDEWANKPAEADNMIKAVKAMFKWAMEQGDIDHNPAQGVKPIHQSKGGAKPWTAADLRKFRDKHPPGTMPHLWLTLQMFTACRVGDAVWLGRGNEVQIDGITWLRWQPRKKGSAPVELPMLPPLYKAIRAQTVVGEAYILTDRGKPFTDANSMRNKIRKWCDEAGLEDRSSHGVRKAVAELLAELGCTQYQIMSVMAHTQAKTSEIYTKGIERRNLAREAVAMLAGLEW